MPLSTVYITAPAAAAAMGLYFFGRNLPNNHEVGGGGISATSVRVAKEKEYGKSIAAQPKLAPQFDGLFCFETIVGH